MKNKWGEEMKKYRVKVSFKCDYDAESEEEVMDMIGEEYGLGDVESLDIDINEISEVKK